MEKSVQTPQKRVEHDAAAERRAAERLELARLVGRIVAGDSRGLEELVARHGVEMSTYLLAALEDAGQFDAAMESVLVEVLTRIRRAPTTDKRGFRKFLFECAARSLHTGKKMSDRPTGVWPRNLTAREVYVAESAGSITLDVATRAMRGLPASDRELLVLRYKLGFDYDEISDILKQARVQFEDRLLNARMRFRSNLAGLLEGSAKGAATA